MKHTPVDERAQGVKAAAGHFLSEDKLRELAPAIFSKTHAPGASEKYLQVSTADVLRTFAQRGFHPVEARQDWAKDVNPAWGFHTVTLQRKDVGSVLTKDVVIPRAVLSNSHNRTRRWSVAGGFFRLVCTNGMIAPLVGKNGEDLAFTGRALHIKSEKTPKPEQLIERALLAIDKGTAIVEEMAKTTLSKIAQLKFAKEATRLMYGANYMKDVDPHAWLAARRPQDEGDDLWRVFNRIQENVIKGGVRKDKEGGTTRPYGASRQTGALASVRMNENLWKFAVSMLS